MLLLYPTENYLSPDLIHLSDNNPVPQECPVVSEMSSRECLHVVHLMFACLDDFVVGWRSAHRGRPVDMTELIRLGLVLALSVKRFFGVNWLGVSLRSTGASTPLNYKLQHLWKPFDFDLLGLHLSIYAKLTHIQPFPISVELDVVGDAESSGRTE